MNELLAEYLRKFVIVFFYDILVYSENLHKHLEHVQLVFDRLQENQFYVKKKKCSFGQLKGEYLGHMISAQVVTTDPEKIATMIKWPQPKTVKGLIRFLRLIGYY